MEMSYEARVPSPKSRNHGVALELAVGFEPSCWLWPHVPLSSCAWFSTQAPDDPANDSERTMALTSASRRLGRSADRRRGDMRRVFILMVSARHVARGPLDRVKDRRGPARQANRELAA